MIFYLYLIPPIWLSLLLAKLLKWLISLPLMMLTGPQLSTLVQCIPFLTVIGLVVGFVGVFFLLAEVVYDKKTPRNLDALLIFLGVLLVSVSAVLADWWLVWLWLVLSLLLAPCGVVAMLKLQGGNRADHLLTSAIWYLATLAFLFVASYVVFFRL